MLTTLHPWTPAVAVKTLTTIDDAELPASSEKRAPARGALRRSPGSKGRHDERSFCVHIPPVRQRPVMLGAKHRLRQHGGGRCDGSIFS
jgi:hypothetical protein